jgi:hypothetical protein
MPLLQLIGPPHDTTHAEVPQSISFAHESGPPHVTVHVVAPLQFTPPAQSIDSGQLTRHATPSGHSMVSAHVPEPQSNVHVPPEQTPPPVQTSLQSGASPGVPSTCASVVSASPLPSTELPSSPPSTSSGSSLALLPS